MFNVFKKKALTEIYAPVAGDILNLEKVSDPVFSSKSMGDGFAVIPKSNELYSPIKGSVVSIFPTKHAIGLVDERGNEVLIHIGIDTVALQGEGFTIFVTEGQSIGPEKKLAEVDFSYLMQKQKETTTMVIFTNLAERTLTIHQGMTDAGVVIGKIK